MRRLYSPPDDFEATIRIYTPNEGGRQSPPFNGIRWDFAFADDPPAKELHVIWPDFYDKLGDSLPTDRPMPVGVDLPARMTVIHDDLRTTSYRSRIHEGTRFYCHEGPKRVAEGRVTRITGLSNDRPAHHAG